MTIRGRVSNGVIVLDEGQTLPEGESVSVKVVQPLVEASLPMTESSTDIDHTDRPFLAFVRKFAGKAPNLPPDIAVNHDHYAHGTPKK